MAFLKVEDVMKVPMAMVASFYRRPSEVSESVKSFSIPLSLPLAPSSLALSFMAFVAVEDEAKAFQLGGECKWEWRELITYQGFVELDHAVA